MATKSKFDGLAAAVAMIGADHKGVRRDDQILNAVRAADKLLKNHGLRWVDVGQALVQRDKAEQRASALLDAGETLARERDVLSAELERLRRNASANGGGALAQAWVDTSTPRTVESRHAAWLLGLGRHFTQKETDFLNSCARRRGPLSPAMRDWLSDLVRTTVARTGMSPPP